MIDYSKRYDEFDPKHGRGGRLWRSLRDKVCPPGSICALCGKPIIFGLRPRHPMGPSVDHIVSPLDGGHPTDLANLRPAHYGCNSARGRPSRTKSATRPRTRNY